MFRIKNQVVLIVVDIVVIVQNFKATHYTKGIVSPRISAVLLIPLVYDINNLKCRLNLILIKCLSISHGIITNMYYVFHMFFLQNLWTFSSLFILFFIYCKQLVPRKYEAPVYSYIKRYQHQTWNTCSSWQGTVTT